MNPDQDWRETAYMNRENWPEAIPPMGPHRKGGPHTWPRKAHHDPHDLDDYPTNHIDAMECGYSYGGDVCPYCGVPLSNTEEVVDQDGDSGGVLRLHSHRSRVGTLGVPPMRVAPRRYAICFECSDVKNEEYDRTVQWLHSVEMPASSHGCFSRRRPISRYRCSRCGGISLE